MRIACISRSLQVTIGKLDRFLKFEWMFGLIFLFLMGFLGFSGHLKMRFHRIIMVGKDCKIM